MSWYDEVADGKTARASWLAVMTSKASSRTASKDKAARRYVKARRGKQASLVAVKAKAS